MSAALLGSSAGLGLGVLYMTTGLSDHAVERAAEVRMAEAAYSYPGGSHLEANGAGMRLGPRRRSFLNFNRTPSSSAHIHSLIPRAYMCSGARLRL